MHKFEEAALFQKNTFKSFRTKTMYRKKLLKIGATGRAKRKNGSARAASNQRQGSSTTSAASKEKSAQRALFLQISHPAPIYHFKKMGSAGVRCAQLDRVGSPYSEGHGQKHIINIIMPTELFSLFVCFFHFFAPIAP